MLFVQLVLANLIFCTLNVIKSEELLNNTDTTTSEATVTAAISSSIENDLNFLAKQDLHTTPKNLNPESITAEEDDFYSLTLENFATTSANLYESITPSSTTIRNDIKETTPSWELIYPEQNSTTNNLKAFLSSSNDPVSETFTSESLEAALPKYFKVDDVTNCQKFFDQCLQQVLANIVPKLKDGNRPLNVPSLDPLYFNATAFQYNSGPFAGYITIRYALIYGLTTMKFKKVDFYKQADKFKARVFLLVPKMSVIGSYKGDMHVNNVRVRPRGDFNVSVTGLGVNLLSLGVTYNKDHHTFLKFTKGNATTTLKDSKVNATGIFPDQRLNEIVINVANQYWRDLLNVVLPETRNNWLPILLDTLNAALSMVPFDFLK